MRHGITFVGLALLLAVLVAEEARADGHFLYATINWERASTENYAVTFTIRSSWTKSWEGWPSNLDFSAPILLRGFRTPTLTVMGDNLNASSTFLNLQVEESRELGEPYGDWIQGVTNFTYIFPGPGKYHAEFTGCCMAGAAEESDFSIASAVEIFHDEPSLAPRLLTLPNVFALPGNSFTVPAIHPHGKPATASYRWMMPITRPSPGFSVAADSGIVTVAGNQQHGTYDVYVEVWVLHYEGEGCQAGCLSGSMSSVIFKVVVFSPVYTPTVVHVGGMQFQTTPDQMYEFRTGFPVEIMVHIQRTFSDSTLMLHQQHALPPWLTATFNATSGAVHLMWNKPCVGQSYEALYCFMAMELPHLLNATSQSCLHIRIVEDEAPAFLPELEFLDAEPVPSLQWMMGRERAFAVRVLDAAEMDQVATLELMSNTSIPMGALLEPVMLHGNTARRVFRWMPLMTAGGGTYQLCWSTTDTPGVTYEQCRLGTRTRHMCMEIQVMACRYAVRPQESMNDVAALFNTDWVQLWALNPAINSPDSEVGYNSNLEAKGAVVNTGHLYTVSNGDYAAAVAYKFGMTVKHLLNLNAQLAGMADNAPLVPGTALCIIPNSCLRD